MAATDPILRPGAEAVARFDLLPRLETVADWFWDFCASGYGPHAATKLVAMDADRVVPLESPASAIREAGPPGPLAAPYLGLVEEVQKSVGDQATLAVLLASGLVRRAAQGVHEGAPVAAYLDGYRAARRQVLAELSALARPADAGTCLASVDPLALAGLGGIEELARQGPVHLDQVCIETSNGDTGWAPGIVAPLRGAKARSRHSDVRVLVTRQGPPKPRSGLSGVLRDADAVRAWHEKADAASAGLCRRLTGAGVGLWVCHGSIDDALAAKLHQNGILTWGDAGRTSIQCLLASTGADWCADPNRLETDAIGRADLVPRRRPHKDWLVVGPDFAATWIVPLAGGPPEAAQDRAERVLRAAAPVLEDPRGLPGGGRWQHQIAGRLAAVAPHGPGKSPLGLTAAARVFRDLMQALRRAAGHDPLAEWFLDEVTDPYPCVRRAVASGFDAAISMLRTDAMHARRPSGPEDLRGGLGPAGSPKGMPGDIPPLM